MDKAIKALEAFDRLMNRLLEYEEYLCYCVNADIDWKTDYDIEDETIVREALEQLKDMNE